MAFLIINSKLIDEEQGMISVRDRGFRYGDGVFETMAVYKGVAYQLNWHLARLSASLKAVRIDFDVTSILDPCRALLLQNNVEEGLLRITISRGLGGRGYSPDRNTPPTYVIETLPMPPRWRKPVFLWKSQYERISPTALPIRYKLSQGLNSTLARIEAEDHECLDALQLNGKGEICETSSANIFWLKDDILYTPALDCGVLEGATRATILRISPYPVKEVMALLSELAEAKAVCICNSVWGILPVTLLKPNGYYWESGKLAKQLQDLLTMDIEMYAETIR